MSPSVIVQSFSTEEGAPRLRVICNHCNRHIGIGEDDGYCPLCLNEIERLNIAAWTEYASLDKRGGRR